MMAVVGRRDSFLNNIIPLCVFLLIIMMSASSSKAISNVLTTGQTFRRGSKLGYANSDVRFVLTYNCDLILQDDEGHVRWLYRYLWKDLAYRGCTLSFTDNGRLVITTRGRLLWNSTNDKSRVGKYIAVLRPEAELVIYGPAIWGVGEPQVKESSISIISNNINSNEMASSMTNLKNRRPAIHNVLFSGQTLKNSDKISENGYSFILDDCELILKDSRGKISWQTWTHGNGVNCFARLNHLGRLAIFDVESHNLVWKVRLVWESDVALPPRVPAEYALVMQSNGTATIYGPKVWSSNEDNLREILTKMPTVEM